MRYFLTLAYKGSNYAGWQRQPNAVSVQETLETALATILRQPAVLTGCGRTDAGVHARYYVAHLDIEGDLPDTFLIGLNSLLPQDIAVYAATQMPPDAHARYDAFARQYEYRINLQKNPFETETAWFYPQGRRLQLSGLQAVAELLQQYEAFFPFCKTHSGVEHYVCSNLNALWEFDEVAQQLIFHISANRFLRGMVRLIVGACVQVGQGQLTLKDVQTALDKQIALEKNLSVPAEGLALTGVKYPYPV
ncbi:MAG: tRNA pseudouridine(38-40) synthase TruA [Lewinellaceae bacterium]|nr:tRNA pseudouridine(38-40) synthase TruA [Saprospiraceae bacterium]MCB9332376.1 tRNA pseudouridine(38-40) synthase TruA [Lewinellaceae bacterium]